MTVNFQLDLPVNDVQQAQKIANFVATLVKSLDAKDLVKIANKDAKKLSGLVKKFI